MLVDSHSETELSLHLGMEADLRVDVLGPVGEDGSGGILMSINVIIDVAVLPHTFLT